MRRSRRPSARRCLRRGRGRGRRGRRLAWVATSKEKCGMTVKLPGRGTQSWWGPTPRPSRPRYYVPPPAAQHARARLSCRWPLRSPRPALHLSPTYLGPPQAAEPASGAQGPDSAVEVTLSNWSLGHSPLHSSSAPPGTLTSPTSTPPTSLSNTQSPTSSPPPPRTASRHA